MEGGNLWLAMWRPLAVSNSEPPKTQVCQGPFQLDTPKAEVVTYKTPHYCFCIRAGITSQHYEDGWEDQQDEEDSDGEESEDEKTPAREILPSLPPPPQVESKKLENTVYYFCSHSHLSGEHCTCCKCDCDMCEC